MEAVWQHGGGNSVCRWGKCPSFLLKPLAPKMSVHGPSDPTIKHVQA